MYSSTNAFLNVPIQNCTDNLYNIKVNNFLSWSTLLIEFNHLVQAHDNDIHNWP